MVSPLDPLQVAADEAISTWPGVRAKQVFGHRGYVRGKKMFAFFAQDGLAFKAAPETAESLYKSGAAAPFVYGGSMVMRGWPVMPLGDDAALERALSATRQSYEALA